MPKESAIQNRIKGWITDNYSSSQVRIMHGTAFVIGGDPDIISCINGVMVVIETKQKGKRATKRQRKRLRDWAKAGAVAIEADSLTRVQKILSPSTAIPERAGYVYFLKENPIIPD